MEIFELGKVKAATGDLAGAITAYGEVYHQGPNFPVKSVTQTLALYQLGRLEEETGDLDNARAHYRQFLDRWEKADLEIPEVEEARSRLAHLDNGVGS